MNQVQYVSCVSQIDLIIEFINLEGNNGKAWTIVTI